MFGVELGGPRWLKVWLEKTLAQLGHLGQIDGSGVAVLRQRLHLLYSLGWLDADLLLVLALLQREACQSGDGSSGPLPLQSSSQVVLLRER